MANDKSCNVAIPVHVPQGFSVSVLQVDYRGFIRDIDINRAQSNYGYGNTSPYNNDYSQYGYRRY